MEIQNLILKYYRELLLIAGSLILALSIAPIISLKYYKRFHESKWDDKFWPFSSRDGYYYDRYIRQTNFVLAGISLVIIAIYKFIYP
jgi:hypothetical protein